MKELTFADIRAIFEVADELNLSRRDLASQIMDSIEDFMVDDYRFIRSDSIDGIQCDELSGDPYMLGCFTGWFIADVSDLSYDIVTALQEAEKFEELGQHLIDNDFVGEMQSEYSRLDGYGHHFASYDGATNEELLYLGYYHFRN